jgi:hypothetical protein
VVVFQATGISAPNMEALRDDTFAPPEMRKGGTLMMHFREAVGAPTEITEMVAGKYTACATVVPVLDPSMARFMMDQMDSLPMKCQEVAIDASPVSIKLVVPHAWTVPPAPPK